MNNFEHSLREGYAKKVDVNTVRAKSLVQSSHEAIETAKSIPIEERKLKTIFRELYEGLREYCDALGYIKGYKFLSHEAITHFLSDILHEHSLALQFDRLRKIRNGINYYGEAITPETIREALQEVPEMIIKLEKFSR